MVTKTTGCSQFWYQPQRSMQILNGLHSGHKGLCRNVSTAALILKFEKEPRVVNKQLDVWAALPVWMGGRQKVSFSWRELNRRYSVAPLVALWLYRLRCRCLCVM